jgi:hypothetical protein
MFKDELSEIVDYDREVEPKTPSNSLTTRNTKIRKSTSQMSTSQARSINDPLYKKMIYYRELYYKYRDLIHRKYGHGVSARARR